MKHALWIVAISVLLIQPWAIGTDQTSTGFLSRSLAKNGDHYAYQVYLPADYSPAKKWPVVVFLHGIGAGGRDGYRQTQGGVGDTVRSHPEWIPAIVLFPQSPNDSEWMGFNAELVIAELDATLREFNADPDRVYLSGLSMGGVGVYQLGQDYPDRFAALVISSGTPFIPSWRLQQLGMPDVDRSRSAFKKVAHQLPDVPIWIFHGTADDGVPFKDAKDMVSALRSIGRNPRYTWYRDKGHDSCGLPFEEKDLWTWLFAIKKHPQ